MLDLRIGGAPGYLLLRAFSHAPAMGLSGDGEEVSGAEKLESDFGVDVWRYIDGKAVVDYGCGSGHEAVAAALHGATAVVGIDIADANIAAAVRRAEIGGVAGRCTFLNSRRSPDRLDLLRGSVDTVFSLDAFEHFSKPDKVLAEMRSMLKPGGHLLVNFGPPWAHPYGAHNRYFTRFPWAQLIFTEQTLLKVRALFRDDGAMRIEDVPGGVNRMTVSRFKSLIETPGFETEVFRLRPVRRCGWLVDRGICVEHLTSAVMCRLARRD